MATTFGRQPLVSRRDPRTTSDAPRRAASDFRPQRSLSTLIESEIIPRLMVAHAAAPVPSIDAAIRPDEAASFAPLALEIEADELLGCVEQVLARGVSVDAVLVDLLAPAARILGEYWEADRCDFVDVTMGLWRLQEVVHELSSRGSPVRAGDLGWRALLTPMPGEQHGFGTLVIGELFAREGWAVERLSDPSMRDLIDVVAGEWFDLVGLTVTCDCHTGALPSAIASLRAVSRNPRLRIMVGGRVFVGDPTLADRIGADGTARDGRAAVMMAAALVGEERYEAVARG